MATSEYIGSAWNTKTLQQDEKLCKDFSFFAPKGPGRYVPLLASGQSSGCTSVCSAWYPRDPGFARTAVGPPIDDQVMHFASFRQQSAAPRGQVHLKRSAFRELPVSVYVDGFIGNAALDVEAHGLHAAVLSSREKSKIGISDTLGNKFCSIKPFQRKPREIEMTSTCIFQMMAACYWPAILVDMPARCHFQARRCYSRA